MGIFITALAVPAAAGDEPYLAITPATTEVDSDRIWSVQSRVLQDHFLQEKSIA